jgi:imidazolonepropionase-like amidohydrolase
MPRVLAVCLLFALAGCKVNEETKLVAIIGAVLIDGNGGPPITDSVVVISGTRIRSAGLRANVPIPAGSDKINGSGKFLTPGLIDLSGPDDAASRNAALLAGVTTTRTFDLSRGFIGETADPEAARRRVAELAAKRVDFLYIGSRGKRPTREVTDAVLEEARKYNIPVTGYCSSIAEARYLVSAGVASLVGTFSDSADLDSDFLAKLRALKIVVAPNLSTEAEKRNTKTMAAAGVLLGVAGGTMELLAEAGLSPLEISMAATRNGAMALRRLDEIGTIEAGKRADLLLLNANPIEDVRNFQRIDQIMHDGEWVDRAALKTK